MNKPEFTKCVSAKTRVYYMDVYADSKSNRYVSISEIDKKQNKPRQRIVVYADHIAEFMAALAETAEHIKTSANVKV